MATIPTLSAWLESTKLGRDQPRSSEMKANDKAIEPGAPAKAFEAVQVLLHRSAYGNTLATKGLAKVAGKLF